MEQYDIEEFDEEYLNLVEMLNSCELSPLEEYTINKFCESLESGHLQESSIREQTFRVFNTNEDKFNEFLMWTGQHNILEEVVPAEYKNELRMFEGIGKFFAGLKGFTGFLPTVMLYILPKVLMGFAPQFIMPIMAAGGVLKLIFGIRQCLKNPNFKIASKPRKAAMMSLAITSQLLQVAMAIGLNAPSAGVDPTAGGINGTIAKYAQKISNIICKFLPGEPKVIRMYLPIAASLAGVVGLKGKPEDPDTIKNLATMSPEELKNKGIIDENAPDDQVAKLKDAATKANAEIEKRNSQFNELEKDANKLNASAINKKLQDTYAASAKNNQNNEQVNQTTSIQPMSTQTA